MGYAGRYLATRIAEAALALVVLVTLTFFMVHAMPGGPGYAILGLKSQPTALAAVNLQLGVDTPILYQYGAWWRHLAHGSLGTSYVLNRPVAVVLLDYAGRTLPLQAAGLGLGLVLSFVGGLAHGALYRAWAGRLLGGLELLLYATPGFVIGTFLVLATEGWLPPGGIADLHQAVPSLTDRLAHLVLPATSIGLMTYSMLARYLAESIHAELASAYALTAAAKGLAPMPILPASYHAECAASGGDAARPFLAGPVRRQRGDRKPVRLSRRRLAAVAQRAGA